MNEKEYYRRLTRQCEKLPAELRELFVHCRTSASPELIHRLRVSLRRFRLLLRMSAPIVRTEAARKYRRWSRSVSRVTSRLRDHDVSAQWIRRHSADAGLLERLEARRARIRRGLGRNLSSPPGDPLPETNAGREPQSLAQVRRRYRRTLKSLSREVLRQLDHFFRLPPLAQHEFRRELRRWRYLRELALRRRRWLKDPLLKALVRLQVAIGEQQDRLAADATLAGLPDSPVIRDLRSLLHREQKECVEEIRSSIQGLRKKVPPGS
jgi:CHAD domain-containing protein